MQRPRESALPEGGRERYLQTRRHNRGLLLREDVSECDLASELATLYRAWGGTSWTLQQNWLNFSSPPCNFWQGVYCEVDGASNATSISLHLQNNRLVGNVGALAGHCLVKVVNLYLDDNEGLTGELPRNWPLLLPRLETLWLDNSGITGELPISWGSWNSLRDLYLFDCQGLTGELPQEWGSLHNIEKLSLSQNQNIQGVLPRSWRTMDALTQLYLYDMDGLTGSVPSEWSELKSIEKLMIYSMDKISGPLPTSFGALSTLKTLSFSQNTKMTGSLPVEWASLYNLEKLFLYQSPNIRGTLPPEWGEGMSSIQVLSLDTMAGLSGPLPESWGNMSNLAALSLDGNVGLTGDLPGLWSKLRNLRKLYADGLVGLQGILPPSWSEMESLELLYLSHAPGIRGELPPSWGWGMPKLQQLRLERCNIGGEIPRSWLTNMSELHLLTLNGNNLRGKVPTLPPTLFEPYNVSETTKQGGTRQTFTKQFTPAILLHNNRLSCKMPVVEGHTTFGNTDHDHNKHSNVLIIPGNAFYGPAPDYTNKWMRNATDMYIGQIEIFGIAMYSSTWELISVLIGMCACIPFAFALYKKSRIHFGFRFQFAGFGRQSSEHNEENGLARHIPAASFANPAFGLDAEYDRSGKSSNESDDNTSSRPMSFNLRRARMRSLKLKKHGSRGKLSLWGGQVEIRLKSERRVDSWGDGSDWRSSQAAAAAAAAVVGDGKHERVPSELRDMIGEELARSREASGEAGSGDASDVQSDFASRRSHSRSGSQSRGSPLRLGKNKDSRRHRRRVSSDAWLVLEPLGELSTEQNVSTVQSVELIHAETLEFLGLASIPAIFCILPVLIAGANYYECGEPLSKTTAAYLADSVPAELAFAIMTSMWLFACVIWLFGVYDRYDVRLALESALAEAADATASIADTTVASTSVSQTTSPIRNAAQVDSSATGIRSSTTLLYDDSQLDEEEELERRLWLQKQRKWQKNNHCSRFAWGMVFLFAVGLLSIPGMCYALTLSLPPENTTFMHNRYLISLFRNGSSALLSFTNLVLVPIVVDLAGKRAGLDPRNMLLFTKVCTTWLFSTIFYVLFCNDCYGYWFAYWDPCVPVDGNRSTEFDIRIWGDHYKRNAAGDIIGLEELVVIKTEDICSEGVSFVHGTCARGIIEMLTPLLLGKLLIEGLAVPFFTVFVSWPLEAAAKKWILGEPRIQGPTEKTELIVSKILTSLEIAIVLGPLMPLVVPLTGLSILPSLFQFRIGCRDFNAECIGKNASLGPCWFLALTLMLGQGLAVFFFYDSDLFVGLPIVAVSASVCAALSLALLGGFGGALLNSVDAAINLCFGCGADDHASRYHDNEYDNQYGINGGAQARRRPLLLGEDDEEEFLSL